MKFTPTPDDLIRLAVSQEAIANSAKATAERLRQLAGDMQTVSFSFLEYVDPASNFAQIKAS